MRLALFICLVVCPILAQAQYAVRYLGANTNGISETFPLEVRERVPAGTIPAGFHTNMTLAQLDALQALTAPAMNAHLRAIRDTNDLAIVIIQSQIKIDLAEIESAVTNWRNMTAQQKDALSLTRLRVEANRSMLERGDIEIIKQRSKDTNSVPTR